MSGKFAESSKNRSLRDKWDQWESELEEFGERGR